MVNPLRLPLIAGRVRAYFAPVDRAARVPAAFNPAANTGWALDAPPAPWTDLGWVQGFVRTSESKLLDVEAGSPAVTQVQARQKIGATVHCQFTQWSRLAMALSTASDSVNLLAPGSAAFALGAGSTANALYVAGTSSLTAGSFVVVDVDYSGQTGFIGSGGSGTFVRDASIFAGDPNTIRRYSLNVGQVQSIAADGSLQLASVLLAGAPSPGMRVQQIMGFGDREGSSFFPEWSGLFVQQGSQGERLFFYYPRLQAMAGAKETIQVLYPSMSTVLLDASFRALPAADKADGTATVCYRSFVPGQNCRI